MEKEWIDINIKKPNEYGRYLVNVYEYEFGDFVMIADWMNDDKCFISNGMVPIANLVTHWKELDNPPIRYI